MRLRLACVVALLVPLSGCFIVFDDDPKCRGSRIVPPVIQVRNPYTGLCEAQDEPDGCGGSDDGTPSGDGPAPEHEHWALCSTGCEDLEENVCRAADACRAIYAESEAGRTYQACFGTATDGPVNGAGCAVEDAHECSRRNDCAAIHGPLGFVECIDE